MFGQEIKSLIVLRSRVLEIFLVDPFQSYKIDFPAVVVKHLEIVDEDKLNELIISFLAQIGLENQKALMILGEDVCFTKIIDRDTPEREQQIIEDFFDKVPLDRVHLIRKIFIQAEQLVAVGTNRKLYELILKSFATKEWEVEAILPSAVFGSVKSLDQSTVSQIVNSKDLIKLANFLDQRAEVVVVNNPSELEDEKKEAKVSFKQFLGLMLAIGLLIVSVVFAMFRLGYLNWPLTGIADQTTNDSYTANNSEPVTTGSESSPSGQGSESSESGKINKDKLKVQVLNGSGVAGQANKVKDLLSELGFQNIELGNSTSSGEVDTKLEYTKMVKEEEVNQIENQLAKLFKSVVKSPRDDLKSFDVKITTGK